MIKLIERVDNELIKKNIMPMVTCIATWVVAILFLFRNMEMGIATMSTFILMTIQLISSINDLYNRTIPINLMIFALALGLLICGIFYKTNALINCILGGIAAFAVMKLLIMISKRQVGGGDLALMTVTGFFAGINSFFSILFISIVLAGLYSLFLVFTKKGNKETEIPFAPFVLLGTVLLALGGIW